MRIPRVESAVDRLAARERGGGAERPSSPIVAPPMAPEQRRRQIRIRAALAAAPLLILFPILAHKAYKLQIHRGHDMRALAEEQHLRKIKLAAPRGTIYDRTGQPLAISVDVESAFANPRQIADLDKLEAAQRIASALGEPTSRIEARLARPGYFTWLKRRLVPDEVRELKELGIPGVGTTTESRRFYPNRELAGALIGVAGQDGSGLEGIEKHFDQALAGKSAQLRGLRDAKGRPILADGLGPAGTSSARAAMAGNDVVLTIDRAIQYQAEQVLADTVSKHQARGAVAVVMDPHTGDVLALAQAPSFDPNRVGEGGEKNLGFKKKLHAITDVFEPGSTFKVFVMAAALEAKLTQPDERIDVENGRMRIGRHTIHDTHPQKVVSSAEIITKSSNIGAAKLGMRLGKTQLHRYLTQFGFGGRSDIDLPGEVGGILHAPKKWSEVGLANIAFGQGVAVSALQLCAGLSAIANGGVLMRPRLVEKIVEHGSPKNRAVGAYAPEPRGRVISTETARTVAAMMRTVTTKDGTAKQAALPGYGVAGKTGTAQKAGAQGGYDPDKWVSSFIGFVPASAPRLAIVVIVDEPKGDHLGGSVAAPAFRRIAEEALRYLAVPYAEPLPVEVAKAPQPGQKTATPATPAPASAPVVVRDTTVEKGRIPDFRGLTIREALRTAQQAGVALEVEGSGEAVGQEPAAGTPARSCRVKFGGGRG